MLPLVPRSRDPVELVSFTYCKTKKHGGIVIMRPGSGRSLRASASVGVPRWLGLAACRALRVVSQHLHVQQVGTKRCGNHLLLFVAMPRARDSDAAEERAGYLFWCPRLRHALLTRTTTSEANARALALFAALKTAREASFVVEERHVERTHRCALSVPACAAVAHPGAWSLSLDISGDDQPKLRRALRTVFLCFM